MFKDIFVQGSRAMISTLSWSGSTVSGYPEAESSLEMYQVPEVPDRKLEDEDSAEDKSITEDVVSGRLSLVHQVRRGLDSFDRTTFDRPTFDHTTFDRTIFDRTTFDHTTVDQTTFDHTTFDRTTFDRTIFDQTFD
jgi:hypothetical protein